MFGQSTNTNQNKSVSKSKDSKKKQEGTSSKKQRVFINKSNMASTSRQATTSANVSSNSKAMSQCQTHTKPTLPSHSSAYYGVTIPDDLMENILFRFLYNIPANEKNDMIRIAFYIEAAHWFFVDFYCTPNAETAEEQCKKLSFQQFFRQVFNKCDYLQSQRGVVDMLIENFRQYKSSVPTYGVIMLDSKLNYVLLVQGYYAQKSWGFPKGKVNEGELPVECAIREALEEVGFDTKDYIVDTTKTRPLHHFFGDTLVRLYIATDIPMDFPFKPHLRNEIKKISWFSVFDLPRDKQDFEGCSRLGLHPNNFNSVLPFVKKIREFIRSERIERNKPKCTILKSESASVNSAFQPVIPRASSQQKLSILTPKVSARNLERQAADVSSSNKSVVENLFKPLKPDPANQPASFTGQSFLEQFVNANKPDQAEQDAGTSIPANPAGVIGGESQYRRSKDIKQPKPVHGNALIFHVYEAPPEQSSPDSPQKGNEIADMLRSLTKAKATTSDALKNAPASAESRKEDKKTKMREAARSPKLEPFDFEMGGEADSSSPLMKGAASPPKPCAPSLMAPPFMTTPQSSENCDVAARLVPIPMIFDRPPPVISRPIPVKPITAQGFPHFVYNVPPPLIQKFKDLDTKQELEIHKKASLVPTQVRLCEAWKKFTLDRSRFQEVVNCHPQVVNF